MKLFIQEETLNEIGNAIREKTETGDLIAPGDMPGMIRGIVSGADPVIQELEISSNGVYNTYDGVDGFAPIRVNVPQDGGPSAADLVLSSGCSYRFYQGVWDWFIRQYGHQVTTQDVWGCNYMFTSSRVEEIPFAINMSESHTHDFTQIFSSCDNLRELPRIYNAAPKNLTSFASWCSQLREVPDDYFDTWDWSYLDTLTNAYSGQMQGMFSNCSSLRRLPMAAYSHGNPVVHVSYGIFYNMANNCYCLDEIVDLPNPHYNATFTSNAFNNTFVNCGRLKEMTFKEMNPVNWTNQTIDLSQGVGGGVDLSYYMGTETQVTDDASYQALKDHPDWWTSDIAYSRYNHDSAVNTINSLPTTTKTNSNCIIKFKGEAGSATDGGAINTLTEEEIAVAAAKGWTVTFA